MVLRHWSFIRSGPPGPAECSRRSRSWGVATAQHPGGFHPVIRLFSIRSIWPSIETANPERPRVRRRHPPSRDAPPCPDAAAGPPGRPRQSRPCTAAAGGAGPQGLRRPRGAARHVADRLGERARPRPLHAGVLPARRLRPGLLERAAYGGRRRSLFEYWGHEASLSGSSCSRCCAGAWTRAGRGEGIYRDLAAFGRERRDFVDAVLEEVAARADPRPRPRRGAPGAAGGMVGLERHEAGAGMAVLGRC